MEGDHRNTSVTLDVPRTKSLGQVESINPPLLNIINITWNTNNIYLNSFMEERENLDLSYRFDVLKPTI